MPVDRDALERDFIASLRPIFTAQFNRARLLPLSIPFGQFQQEVAGVMAVNLLQAFRAGGNALIVGHNLVVSQGALESIGRQWAMQFANELARRTVDSSRSVATQTIDRVMRTVSPQNRQTAIDLALAAVFMADSRLESIAITEVTRGLSMGENAVVLPFPGNEQRERLIPIWQCVEVAYGIPDSRVCEICAPFDRMSSEVWGGRFPDGPPAHPRCRCKRRWIKASEWARRAA